MTEESREAVAGYLAVMIMVWPAAWLLIGVGPTIAPLWRLVGFYAFMVGAVPLVWAVLEVGIDELLEWSFGPKP